VPPKFFTRCPDAPAGRHLCVDREAGGRSLSRAYDRTGNVTSDDRNLAGSIATPAGDGELTHAYDPLGRLIETKLEGTTLATYAYDRSPTG
jgi:hypothetical protein